jgi:hypothetical protein
MADNPRNKLTTVDILLYLRDRLIDAREQNDVNTLRNLAVFFDMIWDLVNTKQIQAGIGRILENLKNSAHDSIQGVGWKSIIPSEEEIKLALNNEERY